jgi:hypothetical protein
MMELDLSWSGPYSWPEFEESNGLPKLPTLPGVYLWTVEYLGGYLIYAAGITGRSFHKRLREHTPKFQTGEYTVLDIADMRNGRRSEVWHGWGWTPAKRVQFAERQTEIREAAKRQLTGFRVFVAQVDIARVRARLEAAIMNCLYVAPPPFCDLPDRGMSLSPRWPSEEPVTVRNVCESRLHGLPEHLSI